MADVDGVRERLAAEKTEALRRMTDLAHDFDAVVAASRDSNADDEHDPEGATIAFERSQLGALARQTERRLQAIEAAFERLDARTYGICEVCGAPIGEERLEARPATTLCIDHAGGI